MDEREEVGEAPDTDEGVEGDPGLKAAEAEVGAAELSIENANALADSVLSDVRELGVSSQDPELAAQLQNLQALAAQARAAQAIAQARVSGDETAPTPSPFEKLGLNTSLEQAQQFHLEFEKLLEAKAALEHSTSEIITASLYSVLPESASIENVGTFVENANVIIVQKGSLAGSSAEAVKLAVQSGKPIIEIAIEQPEGTDLWENEPETSGKLTPNDKIKLDVYTLILHAKNEGKSITQADGTVGAALNCREGTPGWIKEALVGIYGNAGAARQAMLVEASQTYMNLGLIIRQREYQRLAERIRASNQGKKVMAVVNPAYMKAVSDGLASGNEEKQIEGIKIEEPQINSADVDRLMVDLDRIEQTEANGDELKEKT